MGAAHRGIAKLGFRNMNILTVEALGDYGLHRKTSILKKINI